MKLKCFVKINLVLFPLYLISCISGMPALKEKSDTLVVLPYLFIDMA
jgi:hypothetical protein